MANILSTLFGGKNTKKVSNYNDAGVKTGYTKYKKVYDSPNPGRDVWEEVKTVKAKRKSGMSASGIGGTSGGGKSKIGKGPKSRSKSGDDCFKGSKSCGPNK